MLMMLMMMMMLLLNLLITVSIIIVFDELLVIVEGELVGGVMFKWRGKRLRMLWVLVLIKTEKLYKLLLMLIEATMCRSIWHTFWR